MNEAYGAEPLPTARPVWVAPRGRAILPEEDASGNGGGGRTFDELAAPPRIVKGLDELPVNRR
jgi:hypothetical protein